MTGLILLATILLLAGWFAHRAWSRRRLRRALIETGLTEAEWAIVTHQVPLIATMPADLRKPLEGKISLFLGQVEFIGCNGLEVSDDIALSIAAQACLLVVNTDHWYDNLTTVMVYPGAFKSLRKDHDGYVVSEEMVVRSGESWSRGPVILSWEDSRQGAMITQDGQNVVLHEFAHQLDDMSGHTDGGPPLQPGQSFDTWSRVILAAYDRHRRNVSAGRDTVIDPYGALDHQEFFAVAVETFFERPAALHRAEPELYAQLSELLRLDPRAWGKGS